MIRIRLGRRLLVGAVAVATAVAGATAATASAAVKRAHAGETVRIALDFFPNTNYTGIYVAKAKGFFAREGLNVQILPYTGVDGSVLVTNDRADLAITYPPSILIQRTKGRPVRAVGSIIQRNTAAIAVLADSKYKNLRDLAVGTTYGGFGTPHERPLFSRMFRADGATSISYRDAILTTAAFEALYAKKVDFSALFRGWGDIDARQRGINLRLFPYTRYLGKAADYPNVVFAASDDGIANKADVLKRALKALNDGYTFAAKNPPEAATTLIGEAPSLARSGPLVSESQAFLSKIYLDGKGKWGCAKVTNYSGLGDILFRAGLLTGADNTPITRRPGWGRYFTNSLLPGC